MNNDIWIPRMVIGGLVLLCAGAFAAAVFVPSEQSWLSNIISVIVGGLCGFMAQKIGTSERTERTETVTSETRTIPSLKKD